MARTLRTAAFKKKVALEALKEEKTIAEIAAYMECTPCKSVNGRSN